MVLDDLRAKCVSLPATIVSGLFLLADIVPHLTGSEGGFLGPFEFAWVTILISGTPLLYLAVKRIVCNQGISKISSALLISIAMFAAIWIGDLFAAGEVAWIMAIGELLEDYTTERARRGLKQLITLAPDYGRRIMDGREEKVEVSAIHVGDCLRVLPGEIIPVDGEIIVGETSVDQSIMTGEALPVDKGVGDELFCGTVNCFGAIDMRATTVGKDTSLQKLIRLVQEADQKQAPIQRIADRVASYLVPIALCIAILAGVIQHDLEVAVTILVVFCPCALVLATPTAIMAAIGQATKHGVILKSGEAVEKMGRVNLLAFDKTGTLTQGKLTVCNLYPIDISEAELLTLAATAEARSEHPLAQAIMAEAKEKQLAIGEIQQFKMEAGGGVIVQQRQGTIVCGNETLMSKHQIHLAETFSPIVAQLRQEGKAIIFVAMNQHCVGVIALSDTLRKEAVQTIAQLHQLKTETLLLTGDHPQVATYVAQQVGVKDVHAGLLPKDKVDYLLDLKAKGKCVCMIGDGVNDAPALKLADVGIAMGTMGADLAIDAADIALMQDNLSQLPYLKRLANATTKTIHLSIALSLLINLVAIILSCMKVLTPTTGALVHNAGSCLVVLLAACLYDRKF